MSTLVKSLILTSLIGGALTAGAAHAFTAPPLDANDQAIERIDYACGPGWHMNPWGECVPHRRYYRPPPAAFLFDAPPPWRYRHHHHHW
jgi:hypothetical protein